MMSQNPFNSFLNLVAFDNTLHELEETIKQLQQKHEDVLNKKQQLESSIDMLKQQHREMRKEVDMHELRMKELDALEQEKKKLLDTINTPKEYTSVKREIEAIKRDQHDLEQIVMRAWNSLETVKKTLDAKKGELADSLKAINDELSALETEIKTTQTAYDEQNRTRDKKLGGIPDEWLEKYGAMRSRVYDPVVPVQQGSCSACFYDITDQRLLELKRNALLQCEGCYRFLYMPDAQPEPKDN